LATDDLDKSRIF